MSGGSSSSKRKARARYEVIALFILPTALFILFVFAGSWTFPVFKYTSGGLVPTNNGLGRAGITYHIGTQGYTTDTPNARDELPTPKFQYSAPPTWPFPMSQLPTILLVHFVLAILLLCHLLLLGGLILFKKPFKGQPRQDLIFHPIGVASTFAIVVFVIGVCSTDSWIWSQRTSQLENIEPEPLGYIVIILGLLFSLALLILEVRAWPPRRKNQKQMEKYRAKEKSRAARSGRR